MQFWFDGEGQVQTDLLIYTKTDSRSYLNFASAPPNHSFSGNIYSQSLCLPKVINNRDKLRTRLMELAEYFKKAGYQSRWLTM